MIVETGFVAEGKNSTLVPHVPTVSSRLLKTESSV
jgi:hypothetical protein